MTPEARIAAALAFCDQADALTVAPESWAELTPLEVIHKIAGIVRQRLTPPPVTHTPREGTGPTADYAAARAQLTTTQRANEKQAETEESQ